MCLDVERGNHKRRLTSTGQSLSSKQFSIAVVMRLTAIIAVNLAVLRLVPDVGIAFPRFVFAIVMANLLLAQTFVLSRPLRAFHYTFLIIGFLWIGVIIPLAFRKFSPVPGSLRILEPLACIVGLLPAWAVAAMVSSSMRRWCRRRSERGRIAAAFLKGALISFGFCYLGASLVYSFFGRWNLDPRGEAMGSDLVSSVFDTR
jgi:hypothetical protein